MTPTAPSRLARLTRAALPVAPLALGAIPSAHAQIIYTDPVDLTTSGATLAPTGIYVDLGASGLGGSLRLGTSQHPAPATTDFFFYFIGSGSHLKAGGYQINAQVRTETSLVAGRVVPIRFAAGDPIAGGTLRNDSDINDNGFNNATWAAGTTGFIGVRFPAGTSGAVNGWIRVSYNSDLSITVHDFAYEASGGSILAGAGAPAIPEPSTYAIMAGLLAGSAALYRRRQQKKAAA